MKIGDGRILIAEFPIEHIVLYETQRKMGLFVYKGTSCVCCGVVGTRLLYVQVGKLKRLDLCTEDGTAMTIDHIIPRSEGGLDHYDNMQPMCRICNQIKSDLNFTLNELREYITDKFKHLLGSLDTQYSYIDQRT